MNRVFLILALLAAVILGGFWYVHRARTRALNSGAVFVREPSGKPAPLPSAVTPPAQPAPAGQLAPPGQPAPTAAGTQAPSAGSPPAPPAAQSTSVSDTIPRNPPNGMLFTGSGKYQLYRQGDITWRLNTDTGWACVLFATDAQWRKTRVYQNGCRAFNESSPVRGY